MAEIKTNLNTVWYQNAKGHGIMKGNRLKTNIAIPESLGGSGEGANPKELLVSSAATCYITTLVYMLQRKKFPVDGLIMSSEATNSKEKGLRITHYPHVILSNDATEEQIQSSHELFVAADKGCAIGNMLKKADAQIQIEGQVSLVSDEDIVSQYVEESELG